MFLYLSSNHIMTFSKQFLLHLIFIFIFFSLISASHRNHCYTSSCGLVDVRFPFRISPNQSESCGYAGFDLFCTDGNETALKLPNSEPFLVREIDYGLQRIRLNDPGNCMAKRLLRFNASGSPFSFLNPSNSTFLRCPNSYIDLTSFKPIHCLGNSTSSSFFVMPSFAARFTMTFNCQTVKTLLLPYSWSLSYSTLSGKYSDQDLWLEWDSPDCRDCEKRTKSRCGFIDNTTLRVKCFSSGHNNTSLQLLKVICLSLVGPLIGLTLCVSFVMFRSRRVSSQIQEDVAIAPQPNTSLVVRRTGLDDSTIESYTKVELGESKRLPTRSNDVVCSICLSEYATKETVRCLPECEHCFHTECIDVWLKLHSSCPVCRSNPSPARRGCN